MIPAARGFVKYFQLTKCLQAEKNFSRISVLNLQWVIPVIDTMPSAKRVT